MRLILFDIDGTLLLSPGLGREAKRRAMLEVFGTTGSLNGYDFGGNTDWGILADLLAAHGYTRAAIGRAMPRYAQVIARHMRAIRADYHAEPLPHVLPLLQSLQAREDLLLGIVTGNTRPTAHIKLDMAGIDRELFCIGAYGDEAARRADLTRLAQQRAQAHAQRELPGRHIIIIGDTPADIAAARAIAAIAVAVETGYAARRDLLAAQPDFLLPDLRAFQAQVLD